MKRPDASRERDGASTVGDEERMRPPRCFLEWLRLRLRLRFSASAENTSFSRPRKNERASLTEREAAGEELRTFLFTVLSERNERDIPKYGEVRVWLLMRKICAVRFRCDIPTTKGSWHLSQHEEAVEVAEAAAEAEFQHQLF